MSGFDHFTPDELAGRKGYDIYKKMLRDPQVKSAFNFLLTSITQRQYRFIPTDENQEEIIEFLTYNLESYLRGTFQLALKGVLMGKAWGYSINELNWASIEYNNSLRWAVQSIKQKPYETFSFDFDDYGNIQNIVQHVQGKRIKIPPEKCIIYISHPEIDPLWGESDLRAAYRPYWEKDIITKMEAIYIERLAGGFLVVKKDKDAAGLQPADQNRLDSILANIQKHTSIELPVGYNLDVVHGQSTEAFQQAIANKDRQITKSLLVPNLLGLSDQGATGSFAQAKVHFDTFQMVINDEASYLSDILNEQLIRRIVKVNWGEVEAPRLVFEELTPEQKREMAEAWTKAVQGGSVTNQEQDQERTRELLQYPEMEEQQEEPRKPEEPKEPKEQPEEEPEEMKEFAEPESVIDFAEVAKELDREEKAFRDNLGDIVERMAKDIKDEMKSIFKAVPEDKTKIDWEGNSKKLENSIAKKDKSDLRKLAIDRMTAGYEIGRETAQNALVQKAMKGSSQIQNRVKAVASMSQRVAFAEGMEPEAWEPYVKQQGFFITGVVTGDLLEAARTALNNGIRDEKAFEQIVFDMEEILPNLIQSSDPEKQERLNQARLENIARTNIATSFNQAQLAVYNDPDLGDFVQAYRYTAIMDSRTSDFCEAYNGRVFPKNDTIWGVITPPNHYQCRSTVEPITVLDEWKASNKVKSVQPLAGFGGPIE